MTEKNSDVTLSEKEYELKQEWEHLAKEAREELQNGLRLKKQGHDPQQVEIIRSKALLKFARATVLFCELQKCVAESKVYAAAMIVECALHPECRTCGDLKDLHDKLGLNGCCDDGGRIQ